MAGSWSRGGLAGLRHAAPGASRELDAGYDARALPRTAGLGRSRDCADLLRPAGGDPPGERRDQSPRPNPPLPARPRDGGTIARRPSHASHDPPARRPPDPGRGAGSPRHRLLRDAPAARHSRAMSAATGRRASSMGGGARSRIRSSGPLATRTACGASWRPRTAASSSGSTPRSRRAQAPARPHRRTHRRVLGRASRRRPGLARGTPRAAESLADPAPARPRDPGGPGSRVGVPLRIDADRQRSRQDAAGPGHRNQIVTCARRPSAPDCADDADHDRRLAHVHALAAPSRGGWGLERLIDLGWSSRGSRPGPGAAVQPDCGSSVLRERDGSRRRRPGGGDHLACRPTRDPPTTSPRSPTE